MGNALPKAVESVVVKRFSGQAFRVGFAEMNGWRTSMEDAHVVHMQAGWGFFGVFDGHGGSQCSTFVATRLTQELASSPDPPKDDKAMKDLALRIDAEFLETQQTSGSTGTFTIVTPPKKAGDKFNLRVGNIGDSRVLLGRRDGSMHEGPGSDGALTTDHKPDHPDEKARIKRNGATVEVPQGGIARVNGELAVSRAFGDAQFKETGGPGPEERPVTADPELVSFDCDASDFIILVCDGISEGEFPNREVVKYAADLLWKDGAEAEDPGIAAARICQRALERGSRDNLSCMIVLLGGGKVPGEEVELIPGPADSLSNEGFRNAYAAMSEHACMDLAQSVEKRYGQLKKEVEALGPDDDGEKEGELREELKKFGDGPGQELEGEERTTWFRSWIAKQSAEGESNNNGGGGGGGNPSLERLMQMLQRPGVL